MLCSYAAVAQDDTSQKWQINVETGPGRALTPYYYTNHKATESSYDEIWVSEINLNHKVSKHFLPGLDADAWGKVGGYGQYAPGQQRVVELLVINVVK